MSKYKLHIDREQLWKGCVLNSIAHAINVAHCPDFHMKVHGMDLTIVCKIAKGTRDNYVSSELHDCMSSRCE